MSGWTPDSESERHFHFRPRDAEVSLYSHVCWYMHTYRQVRTLWTATCWRHLPLYIVLLGDLLLAVHVAGRADRAVEVTDRPLST